ncbi:hydroxyacid dehydrogenase [Ancylobacter sp. MQZ15Z-1]|uniref:Hydroxyacid dehydrogenase n=1 Tax=Ancylobacter mangrovi TaxID=2972472 RepID=A0A9X2PEE6_9HYPH|nr:hydroxyacid dehydrogenase [Ancylobacter mangrovi]MCS0494460.1 hydroxyacid dehydrogenase [Ancylobacter mangrovi]
MAADPAGSTGGAPARPLVVLTDPSVHAEAVALLRARFEVLILDSYPSEERLAEAAAGASAILARLGTVTRRVIEAALHLRIVSRHGVGVDAVDLAAATEHGVVVTNTGASNAAAVAEYTFALLLALMRKVPQADAGMRAGLWQRTTQVGGELEGRTLGIFGLGAIGGRVARQGLGFGMKILACDPHPPAIMPEGVRLAGREEVLAGADIVSLHTRLTDETRVMIDARALAAMKPGAVLVNTARGELVDEPALIAALEAGRLGGAALDTFAEEPLAAESPLRRMPNVVLSPHVAGQTEEALLRVGRAAAQAIIDELAGRRPANVHNPEAYGRRPAARSQ